MKEKWLPIETYDFDRGRKRMELRGDGDVIRCDRFIVFSFPHFAFMNFIQARVFYSYSFTQYLVFSLASAL